VTSLGGADARATYVEAGSTALRWMLAAALAALAHLGAVWVVLHRAPVEVAAGRPAAAALIELEPLAVAPKSPAQASPPGPQQAESQPAEALATSEKAVEAAAPDAIERTADAEKPDVAMLDVAARPIAETAPDSAPAPVVDVAAGLAPSEPQINMPALPQQDAANSADAPPSTTPAELASRTLGTTQPAAPAPMVGGIAESETVPPPKASPPKVPVENKRSKVERVERAKPTKPEERPVLRLASAPPTSDGRQADAVAAPKSSTPSMTAAALESWRGELVAHLNRFKRFPPGATRAGTASVAFAVDHAGVVVSVRLIASSGDPLLDGAAVGLLRRASPVPPPPPSEHGVINLTVPIRFDR
jgi:periplasmic protein TonB